MRATVIGILAVVMGAEAAGAEPLTLDAALARAMRANVELAAASADLTAARGRLTQASVLAANPVLTASVTPHRIPGETNIDNAVSLGQELQVGGQRGLRMAAARFDVAHAEELRADHERLVAGEVRRAFAGLVAAERRRALAAEVAAQARRLASVASARLAAGDAGRLEVDLAQLDLVKAEGEAAAAVTEVDRATARLAVALGAGPDETFALTAPDDPPREAPREPDAVERALAARPDLRAARAERARLEGEADLARRVGVVPNPTVRGFYSHENGNETLVGGEIAIPLPIFDRQQGVELDLRGQAASAATTVLRLERQIPRDVRLALAHHRTAEATWERRRRAADAAPAARATLDRALAAGLMGLPDVLVQQDRLREARRADVDAWLDVREAEAEVIEAIGESPW